MYAFCMCGGTITEPNMASLADLTSAIADHERALARIATAVARLEELGDFRADGTLTMAAWLRHHCRLSHRDAKRLLKLGRFLATFEAVRDAATDGTLAAGHVEALRNAVNVPTEAVFAEQQTAVVAAIAPLPIADAEKACHHWRRLAEALVDSPPPPEPVRELRFSTASDGSLVGRFTLDDGVGAEFAHAIQTASTYAGDTDTRSAARRQADALFEIVAFYNANHTKVGTPRHRPHVELMIEADQLASLTTLSQTSRGTPMGAAATNSLLCDSVIHRVVLAKGAVIDYGRATRTVPLDLFRAVAARDRGCRHPGCDRPVAFTDAHHIRHWSKGGPTSLENVALFCTRHHHLIHQPGWIVKMHPNGDIEVTNPEGLTRTSRPPGRNASLFAA